MTVLFPLPCKCAISHTGRHDLRLRALLASLDSAKVCKCCSTVHQTAGALSSPFLRADFVLLGRSKQAHSLGW